MYFLREAVGLENATSPVRLLETGTRQGQLGGSVSLESWKVVPAGSMPGMVGFKGKARAWRRRRRTAS
jgi:hypothetical protein